MIVVIYYIIDELLFVDKLDLLCNIGLIVIYGNNNLLFDDGLDVIYGDNVLVFYDGLEDIYGCKE